MVIRECHIAFQVNNHKYLVLRQPIECTSLDCYSPIFALSRFFSQDVPDICPSLQEINYEVIEKNRTECFHPISQAWNQYLVNIFMSTSNVHRQGENVYIIMPLNQITNSQLFLMKNELFDEIALQNQEQLTSKHIFSKLFSINAVNNKKISKMGLYLTQLVNKDEIYTARVNKSALLLGTFFDNQQWKIFDIPNGVVPSPEQLMTFDSILITGSSSSVLNKSSYVQQAINHLGEAYKRSKTLKILGICYGHQLILQYFGATVLKKQRKAGLQDICLDQEVIQKYEALIPLANLPSLVLSEYHEDFVETVPNQFDLIAKSQSAKVESTISKDGRILTSQFHSELLYPYMQQLTERYKSAGKTLNYKFDPSEEKIKKSIKDSELVLELITQFLNS